MKYKFSYTDSQNNKHARYYSALNSATATEMFWASVDHSIKDEVNLLTVELLEGAQWVKPDRPAAAFPFEKV